MTILLVNDKKLSDIIIIERFVAHFKPLWKWLPIFMKQFSDLCYNFQEMVMFL